MIRIGRSCLTHLNGMCCLHSDITVDEREHTALYFSVPQEREADLCTGRVDAFVMALLPTALRGRHEIICEDPVSDRLQYQLNQNLIPALMLEADNTARHFAHITAPLASERRGSGYAVAAGFSQGPAFLRTLERHRQDSLYPLTHIAVWDLEGTAEETVFQESCQRAGALAREYKLEVLFLRSNMGAVLHEELDAVRVFRELACALALEPLLRVYLRSTDRSAADFQYDPCDCTAYEQLTVGLASTESLMFYLSGPEGPRRIRDAQAKIQIGKPYIEHTADGARLCARVRLRGKNQVMWFSVKEEYARYLTQDRADAFVVALLTPAMRDGTDLQCDAPVSRRLLYQLNQYLIPIMSAHMEEYHEITVQAEPTDEVLECEGAVCTGGTGGVDCMFTLMQNEEIPADSRYKLTHLFLASNGAIEQGVLKDTLQMMMDRAERRLVPETGLKTIGIDTNITDILSENFLQVVNFRHGAVLLALQKLCSVGLIASAYGYFRLKFCFENVAYYEMIVSACLSTEHTAFYSDGASFLRIQKLEWLSNYSLARRAMHPCIDELAERNCGTCGKCVRTQTALYALGKLEAFSKVFDVPAFRKEKTQILAKQYVDTWLCSPPNTHVLEGLTKLRESGTNLTLVKLLAMKMVVVEIMRKVPRKICRTLKKLMR